MSPTKAKTVKRRSQASLVEPMGTGKCSLLPAVQRLDLVPGKLIGDARGGGDQLERDKSLSMEVRPISKPV